MSFITQSGAIATSIFDWCNSVGLGFSDFITLGNKAGLNESDLLEYFFEKKKMKYLLFLITPKIVQKTLFKNPSDWIIFRIYC